MGSNKTLTLSEKCVLSLAHKTAHFGNTTVFDGRTSFTLADSVPFTQYEFQVTASTIIGQGPSATCMSDTPEDGK